MAFFLDEPGYILSILKYLLKIGLGYKTFLSFWKFYRKKQSVPPLKIFSQVFAKIWVDAYTLARGKTMDI